MIEYDTHILVREVRVVKRLRRRNRFLSTLGSFRWIFSYALGIYKVEKDDERISTNRGIEENEKEEGKTDFGTPSILTRNPFS